MAVVIVAWALLVPPFAVPDETAHFAYVQSLAENGERPPEAHGDAKVRLFSTEEQLARGFARNSAYLFDPQVKPAWESSAERLWRTKFSGRLPRDDLLAIGPQANHPPLYYAYGVVAYSATPGDDLFDRMLLMRLWSGLLMLVTTAAAWLLVGELVRDRVLQLAGATCVGLQPMATFVSAGVNPDALVFALYAVVLWLVVRLVRRGPTRWTVAGLVAAMVAGSVTKAAVLALAPVVVVALAAAYMRARGPRALVAAAGAAALGVAVLATGLAAGGTVEERVPVDVRPGTLRGFVTYLWDFYLPRLPFQHDYAMPDGGGGWNLHQQTWAAFGSLEVRFPNGLYVLLAAVVVATAAGAAAALWRGLVHVDRLTIVVLGLAVMGLATGLHWADFQNIADGHGHVIQGRYFLPLMPIVGLAVAMGLANLRERLQPVGAGLVIGGMAALQLASLSIVAGRFFA